MNEELKRKWQKFLANNIVADCLECQRQYTIAGTNKLARCGNDWTCGCGGTVEARSAEQIENQRRHWINEHMRN